MNSALVRVPAACPTSNVGFVSPSIVAENSVASEDIAWTLTLKFNFGLTNQEQFFSSLPQPLGATTQQGPWSPHSRGLLITHSGTTHSVWPLDRWSARRRNLYMTSHNTQNWHVHAPGGFRTRNLSKRSSADPRLRRLGRSISWFCSKKVILGSSVFWSHVVICGFWKDDCDGHLWTSCDSSTLICSDVLSAHRGDGCC
jgi:hypothetical protein